MNLEVFERNIARSFGTQIEAEQEESMDEVKICRLRPDCYIITSGTHRVTLTAQDCRSVYGFLLANMARIEHEAYETSLPLAEEWQEHYHQGDQGDQDDHIDHYFDRPIMIGDQEEAYTKGLKMTDQAYIQALEAQVVELRNKLRLMKKERNLYKRDLMKKREATNDPLPSEVRGCTSVFSFWKTLIDC